MSFSPLPTIATLFALALPAGAACLDAASIDEGIEFKLADGRHGVARKEGRAVRADYARGDAQWTDERSGWLGIFDSEASLFRAPLAPGESMVGGGTQTFRWSYSGVPPKPVAGKSWKTTIKEVSTEDIGIESGPVTNRRSYTASYSFVEPREVTLSGCKYQVVAVEGSFVSGEMRFTRRWLYFTDLGFGLETRSTDPRGHAGEGGIGSRGLVALGPRG